MNTVPLATFLEARDAYKAGDKELALKLLAESVGASEPTQIMKDSLGALVDANPAILTLILDQSTK